MIKKYRLPIQGTVIKRDPLQGLDSDPICVIPIVELPNRPTFYSEEAQQEVPYDYSYVCLGYNIDEGWCEIELEAVQEVHDWLTAILPELTIIQGQRNWKLDKSKCK